MIFGWLLSGCYVLSQSVTFLSDRASARQVERVLEDRETPESVRQMLELTYDIREFAQDSLGLETSKNYTKYVELERDHLAYIVYAADALSFNQHTWSFPITGEIPYKGYFKLSDARELQQKLDEQGFDTWVSVVDGFSSLGFFIDPLYSFMADYSAYRLSDLIIHEMVHATVWVKNQSSFNEQLASFVGEEGAKQFITSIYGKDSAQYRDIEESEHDLQVFLELIRALRAELEAVYKDPVLTDSRKLERKTRIIQAFREDFIRSYDSRFLTDRYRAVGEYTINNAYIAMYGVYYPESDILERLYARYDHSITEMVKALADLDGTREDPYSYIDRLMISGES
jgi:predicted aminopeptidase